MDYTFLLMVIAVSSSGVLSPGPLFLINLHYAKRYGHLSGLLCASGHAVVELPLVLAIAVGMLSIDYIDQLRWLIGLVGGIALIVFATMQLYTLTTTTSTSSSSNNVSSSRVFRISTTLHGSLLAGIAFSALNPFFIAWWLTVGMKMITDAYYMASMNGVLLMFIAHIWMDYAWLAGTAYMAKKGMDRIARLHYNARLLYRLLYIALYSVLVYIGIGFIVSSL
ncbi:MAG: LysE family transporter [Candidatus Nitrosocaldus sp.]